MDSSKPNRGLSEISHLFLSSVREKQQGSVRPQRKPPTPMPQVGPNDPTADLTAEEIAHVSGEPSMQAQAPRTRIAPVSAVIASHLNGKQFDRVKEYARHLAGQGLRVGLIELDASEFRLMCFDRVPVEPASDAQLPIETFDPRQMAQSIEELNFDMDRWLLLLPNPRTPEARALLRDVQSWVMLSTCDPDGVVSCYRTLKGLVEQHRPELSLAVLDAGDELQASSVHHKLSGVCRQFLDRPLRREGMILKSHDVAEHLVLLCRPTRDKSQVAAAPQWATVAGFLARAKQSSETAAAEAAVEEASHGDISPGEVAHGEVSRRSVADHLSGTISEPRRVVADVVVEPMSSPSEEFIAKAAQAKMMAMSDAEATIKPVEPAARGEARAAGIDEVLDLTGGEVNESTILSAILHRGQSELIECPLRPPMAPMTCLAVNRDRRLVLLAVARQGLADLKTIGLAYRWLNENRSLVAMALPQLSIDAMQMPSLRLLVDHADLTAEVLQPIMQAGHVTVQAYRALKWGGKTGLLLDAA